MTYLAKILLLLCFPVPVSAKSQPDTSFIFIQLSDPQFGMYPMQKDFHKERQNLTTAIQAINAFKPDFVVITGDFVNRGGDTKQIDAFRETMARLDPSIQLFLVSGNHDVGNKPTPMALKRYRKEFGNDYYSFKRHGQRFIVLNSSIIKSPSSAPEDAEAQSVWLKCVLDSAMAEQSHPIVLQHHPWFVKNAREPNGYFNIPKKTRLESLRLLESHGVNYVFAGHLHANAVGSHRSLTMVTSGPVGTPLGTSPSGIRIVTISPSTIKHKYYALKKIPLSMRAD